MPKDEFDFDDPMELNGVGFFTDEETTDSMIECFIEEFMRMGFSSSRILHLFHHSFYIGVNMALQKRGESFIREIIQKVFARWGREVCWDEPPADVKTKADVEEDRKPEQNRKPLFFDPMGCAIPHEIISGGSQ